MTLRWGIVSAGKISHDFVTSLGTLPEEHHKVVSVAARSGTNAEDFAKKHGIPKSYEGYKKIAEDPDVDIVYVGNLNHQHFEVSKLMLEHGKHVLCEKPLTLNEKQTRILVEISRNRKLFLMEGTWSRSFPVYFELKKLLNSGIIGEPLYVDVSFGFDLKNIDRLQLKEVGGGSILDLGVYVLQFQQFVFRGLTPTKIVAAGHLNQHGTDSSAHAIITYPNGKTATVSTSAIALLPNQAVIIGTKGTITIPEFWCPTKIITAEKTYEFLLPKSSGTYNFHNSVGLSYQAEYARQSINAGKIESENITHEESIQLAHLEDAMRQQIGVVFSEDSN